MPKTRISVDRSTLESLCLFYERVFNRGSRDIFEDLEVTDIQSIKLKHECDNIMERIQYEED